MHERLGFDDRVALPQLDDAGAELLSDDKLDALAAKIGIPADALNDSVNAHNAKTAQRRATLGRGRVIVR